MIETSIALIAFGTILIISLAKLWNLVNKTSVYPKQFIIIGLVIAIICWGIYFTASMSAINQAQTITLDDGGIITSVDNSYITLFNFFPILNFLLLAIGVMTALEGIISLQDILNPKNLKQQYGYNPKQKGTA